MSDMLNTLVKLIRNQDELRAAVVARDALIVQLLVKFGHTEPFRISQADRDKAAKWRTEVVPQKTGLKIHLQKMEEPTSQ